jgi:uncharacterized membrane protein YfcA
LDLSTDLSTQVILFLISLVANIFSAFVTLWLVRWFGLDYRRAVAYTLILVGLFWNGAGAVTLGMLGSIQWPWLPALLPGSLLGGYIGAHLAILKGNRSIKLPTRECGIVPRQKGGGPIQ